MDVKRIFRLLVEGTVTVTKRQQGILSVLAWDPTSYVRTNNGAMLLIAGSGEAKTMDPFSRLTFAGIRDRLVRVDVSEGDTLPNGVVAKEAQPIWVLAGRGTK